MININVVIRVVGCQPRLREALQGGRAVGAMPYLHDKDAAMATMTPLSSNIGRFGDNEQRSEFAYVI